MRQPRFCFLFFTPSKTHYGKTKMPDVPKKAALHIILARLSFKQGDVRDGVSVMHNELRGAQTARSRRGQRWGGESKDAFQPGPRGLCFTVNWTVRNLDVGPFLSYRNTRFLSSALHHCLLAGSQNHTKAAGDLSLETRTAPDGSSACSHLDLSKEPAGPSPSPSALPSGAGS